MKKGLFRRIIVYALIFASVFAVAYWHGLYSIDCIVSDRLFQYKSVPDTKIKIIAIDEKTIQKYGDVSVWSRDISAALVEKLCENPAYAPSVIGFDIMFVSEKEEEADARFAEACAKAGNVVSAVNIVYNRKITVQNGLFEDKNTITMVEYPYEALRGVSDYGFANTYLDTDSYIRYAKTEVAYGEETIRSFPIMIYEKYMAARGEEAVLPKTTEQGFYSFEYTGIPKTYEVVSLCDVLEGEGIDPRAFEDAIVLIGAFAPGMQDAYLVPIERGEQMYGVEIHANIIDALMDGRTGVPVDATVYAVAAALFALAFAFTIEKMKIVPATCATIGFVLFNLFMAKVLYEFGLDIRIIETLLAILLLYSAKLVFGYRHEYAKKRKILDAFRKYVAPEVVEEIALSGDYQLRLGGERRDIAVLFVDIRGFTPMSEGLKPEEVVEILNEYLSLTTNAIFKNKGTLDKFIGDATMAVFNAPFDLDDYVFRAVSAALDIAAGSAALEEKLMARFGKSVSFGIGVNCGAAVVGNIGCEHRMDYTAIGDTVNTAARLESNAARSQILISEAVYKALEGRINASEIGVIPLKGKTKDVFVYQLESIRKADEGI